MMWSQLVDYVFGYDFFISYRWLDGRPYAEALARKLKKLGFACFLDSKEYPVGANWRFAGQRALRKSAKLILVGTPGALESDPVHDEIEYFRQHTKGVVQAIDINEILQRNPGHRLVVLIGGAETLHAKEVPTAPAEPTPAVVLQLANSFRIMRQAQRRFLLMASTIAALFLLACGLSFFAWQSERQKGIAQRNEAQARQLVAAADFQLGQEAATHGNDSEAVAYLVHGLRQAIPTPRLQSRLLGLLLHRAWSFPVSTCEYVDGNSGPPLSPDGKRMLTARDDGSVAVVDVLTGQEVFALKGAGDVRRLAFTPDGLHICTASTTEGVLWRATDGVREQTFAMPEVPTALDVAPDGSRIAIGDREGQLWFYDIASGTVHPPQTVGDGLLQQVQFSHDSQRVITLDAKGTARLLSVEPTQLLATLQDDQKTRKVSLARFTPDGALLVTASPGTLDIWSSYNGKFLQSLDARSVRSVAMTGSVQLLVAAQGLDVQGGTTEGTTGQPPGLQPLNLFPGRAQRWDKDSSGQLVPSARYPHRSEVWDVALPPGCAHPPRLATASWDFTARIWPVRTDSTTPITSLSSPPIWHGAPVQSVAFTADGSHLVTSSLDKKATVWTGRPGRVEVCEQTLGSPARLSALHAGSGRAAVVAMDGSLRFIDAETSQTVGKPIIGLEALAIAWRSDGGALLVVDAAGQFRQVPWQGEAGPPVACAGLGPVLTWRRDGSLLLRADERAGAVLVASARPDEVARKLALPARCRAAAFSPDGARVLTLAGGEEGQPGDLTLWDADSGQSLGTWKTHDIAGPLVFAGSRAVLGSAPTEIFDLTSPGTAGRALDFPDATGIMALSEDGRRLAITYAMVDGTGSVSIFDTATAGLVAQARAPVKSIEAAAFDRRAQKLATMDAVGVVQCWDVETGEPLVDPFGVTLHFGHDGGNLLAFTGDDDGLFRITGASVQSVALPPVLDLASSSQRELLASFAEMVAQCRINDAGQAEHIDPAEALATRGALMKQISPSPAPRSLEGMLLWLVDDPLSRTISPQSQIKCTTYWQQRIVASTPEQWPELQYRVSDWPDLTKSLDDLARQNDDHVQRAARSLATGQRLAAMGQLDEALKSFGEAAELDPENDEAAGQFAQMLLLCGHADVALPWIVEARSVRPQSDTLLRYDARLHFLAGKFLEALERFKTLDRTRGEGTPRPLAGLAAASWALGQNTEALEYYSLLAQSDANYLDRSYVAAIELPAPLRDTLAKVLEAVLAQRSSTGNAHEH